MNPRRVQIMLLICMFLSGYCGIISELSLFNLGTVLLGGANTTLLYTMGLMMFFMGLGSLFTESRWFRSVDFSTFAMIELTLSFLCMISVPSIYILSALYPRYSIHGFFVFSPAIGFLIGMEIPVILRLNQEMGLRLQVNSARVMMSDYFGSLMAFVLFPFLLFPKIGIAHSAYSGGLINLSLAFLTLLFFKKEMKNAGKWFLMFGCMSVFALILGLNLNRFIQTGDNLLYRDPIILQKNTPYQKLIITKKDPFRVDSYSGKAKEPGKLLFRSKNQRFELRKFEETFEKDIRFFINGGLQFSTVDEYRYHEVLTHPAVMLASTAQEALVLGGGDGMVVRELLKYKRMESIVLVDLDRELTDLFRYSELNQLNEGSLRSPKVRIFNVDAFQFLRKVKASFPLIIIDFPDPYSLQTSKLYTRQFYELVRFALKDEGYLAIQATSPLFNRKTFLCIGKTLEAAGFEILPMQVSMRTFEDWGFYLAIKKNDQSISTGKNFIGSAKILSALKNLQIRVPTRYLDQDSLVRATSFGKDIFFDRDKIPVNDLNRLVLSELYKGDLF